MPYLVLRDTTLRNEQLESVTYRAGRVLSDFEVPEFVRGQLADGAAHYRLLLEPLTEAEAHGHRVKATVVEGDHLVDGRVISPPWEDYVGLHPSEVLERLRGADTRDDVRRVKEYERGGLRRAEILDYTAPVEREPFAGYDEMGVRALLAKLDVMPMAAVQEVIAYERAHRKREAVLTYEREPTVPAIPDGGDAVDDTSLTPEGALT